MAELRFRKADLADSDRLFAWRNDPETRRGSVSTAEVPRAWRGRFAYLLAREKTP